MTAIQGFIAPTRRSGELGIHSVDHFHFVVPDLAVAKNFYGEFGLHVGEGDNTLTLKTFEQPHLWGTIGEGSRKKLGYVSFGAFEDDIERFSERLQAMHIERLDPPPGVDSNGLWFRDHDGILVEIKAAVKSSPDEKTHFTFKSTGPGQRGAPLRSATPRTRPRRLSHVLMFTSDVRKAIKFYTRVLGMRLSDHSGDNIAFMHGIHGSDHHMIAFARSSAPGHHHFSWDVGSVDEIGVGALHMLEKGFAKGWGLGRHVLGSNFFHYVQDPWGSFSEYSADIDYVPATCDWPAGDHAPDDSSTRGDRMSRMILCTIMKLELTAPKRAFSASCLGDRLRCRPLPPASPARKRKSVFAKSFRRSQKRDQGTGIDTATGHPNVSMTATPMAPMPGSCSPKSKARRLRRAVSISFKNSVAIGQHVIQERPDAFINERHYLLLRIARQHGFAVRGAMEWKTLADCR